MMHNSLLVDEICQHIPLIDLLNIKQVSPEFYNAFCSHVSGLHKLDLHDIENKVCEYNSNLFIFAVLVQAANKQIISYK